MPTHQLNLKERAVLLTLLAEGQELSNAELHSAAGIRLDGVSRHKLNDLKLVTSEKRGRAYVHQLTEDGAAWCDEELEAERPPRAGASGGALYAILRSLHRYARRSGQRLTEIFQPAEEEDLVGRIAAAYARLSSEPGESWVGLAALRTEIAEVPRDELDAALREMSRTPGVHLQEEANQQSLTDTDHEAAVRFGGSSRHILKIENP
ncbi:hypothetical protein ACIBL3_41055 [Kribbella sp. NPDC050124]|uniref:hypothetical protein n=1 Tax=Kribbella sp. NPDC050124 TaxID=3364114 RepID=UPI00379651F4